MNVFKKLQVARVMLQSKSLKKTGHNKFAGYNYFELGDFLPTVNEIFSEVGLCAVVSYGKETAVMTIKDTDSDGEIIITSPMAEANLKGCHPIQNLGAVETYMRRYLYVTAMEIVEHDAIDAAEPKKQSAKSVAAATADELEASAPGTKEFLQDAAMVVLAAFDESEAAGFDAYVAARTGMDSDEQVAFWGMFDSKKRAAIKRIGEELRGSNA